MTPLAKMPFLPLILLIITYVFRIAGHLARKFRVVSHLCRNFAHVMSWNAEGLGGGWR